MPRPTKPLPADFHIYGPKEGTLKLRKRYKCLGLTVDRWRAESGIYYAAVKPKRVVRPVQVRKAKKRWQAQEAIEDLDDGFDLARCIGSGVYGDW